MSGVTPSTHLSTLAAFQQRAIVSYLRDSSVPVLAPLMQQLAQSYAKEKAAWHQAFDQATIEQIKQLLTYVPLEQHVARLRAEYEQRILLNDAAFFEAAENYPLTTEQRLAVIRNNDYNLILAAAGTGKTSVMVARVLHLLRAGVPAEHILLLAYNTAAAQELRQRVEQRALKMRLRLEAMPTILTFHALGRHILEQSVVPTTLSTFVANSRDREAWLEAWLKTYLSAHPRACRHMVRSFYPWQGRWPFLLKNNKKVVEELYKKGILTEAALLYGKCLQCLRNEGLNKAQIVAALNEAAIAQAAQHVELLWALAQAYQQELGRQQAIDFDDMIIRATHCVEQKRFIPLWQHLLVDEFQDISGARMRLLKQLIQRATAASAALTVVGDDWQAIYRFAGGKLELSTRFDELVGANTKTVLQKTFRYNNSIAEVAGRFVMKNPEQYKKTIQTHHQVSTPHVYLLDSRSPEQENQAVKRLLQVIRTIRKHDSVGTIAVLARYHAVLQPAQRVVAAFYNEAIYYWTFHSAKGLEADYCIILGLDKGKRGFPSQRQHPPLLEALLPRLDDYPNAEERRLFYVALTRAKKKVYLIADALAPSVFIEEMIQENYPIEVVAPTFLLNNSCK